MSVGTNRHTERHYVILISYYIYKEYLLALKLKWLICRNVRTLYCMYMVPPSLVLYYHHPTPHRSTRKGLVIRKDKMLLSHQHKALKLERNGTTKKITKTDFYPIVFFMTYLLKWKHLLTIVTSLNSWLI